MHVPATFGYDHLGSKSMELVPEILVLQCDFDVLVSVVSLGVRLEHSLWIMAVGSRHVKSPKLISSLACNVKFYTPLIFLALH